MKNVYIPTTWEYSASIPLEDIENYLSDEDYKKFKNEYLRFDVLLEYENNTGDKEVGLEPSFDYKSWSSIGLYPTPIISALDKYLSTEPQRLSNEAYEKLCDFIDYQKYGEY